VFSRLRLVEPFLRRALRGPCRVPPGGPVLIAVSGGADSTALLLGLASLARELRLEVRAAHLHHGLRGREADADLRFVADLCGRLGVPLTSARWNTRLRMQRRGLSGQAGLRVLRAEFLAGTARQTGAAVIATAHTADDQLETLLLRLLRGSGLKGLGAMSARRGVWIRPLLEVPRATIEADLRAHGVPWREDASNHDRRYARSRVRHDVIPALVGALGPHAGPAADARARLVSRTVSGLRELRSARRVLDRLAIRLRSRGVGIQAGEIELDTAAWRTYPHAIRRNLLGRLWTRMEAARGLTQGQAQAVLALLDTRRGGAVVSLPGGWVARRDRASVRLQHSRPSPKLDKSLSVPVAVPGEVAWEGVRVGARWLSGPRARARLQTGTLEGELFAADGIRGSLELRSASAHDVFVPFGHRRGRPLGRFLAHQRVPLAGREHPLVLADEGGILWLVGVRRAARAPITSSTRRALWIRTERS
jgi:tRNA(Ile)-lysidine synthase